MVQNHLLQLMGLFAMEPPPSMEPDAIRGEILKVFQSLRPIKPKDVKQQAIRGQYLAARVRGQAVAGYREEPGVNAHSTTETFAALKVYIDNWRWGGVPFYIRTGKRMPTRVTEVVIYFQPTPHVLFSRDATCQSGNQLVVRIQPDEGILLKFGMKTPGTGFGAQTVNMDFHYSSLTNQRIASAYERLLFDAMNGDTTLYSRTEEVMATWRFLDPVLQRWNSDKSIPLYGYPSGTWGPDVADSFIEGEGLTWRYPCKNLNDDGLYCEL
jgi:glucose-6-phosphate 1-dehydrogenase